MKSSRTPDERIEEQPRGAAVQAVLGEVAEFGATREAQPNDVAPPAAQKRTGQILRDPLDDLH